MYTKKLRVSCPVQKNLMNDFLESFLHKYKPKKILNNFWLQNRLQSLKNSRNYNFGYSGYKAFDKVYSTKAASKAFSLFTKNTYTIPLKNT